MNLNKNAQGNSRSETDRRSFLMALGAGALVTLGMELPVRAESFDHSAFEREIPADKKLKAQWVKSLFQRGSPEVYCHDQLRHIAMPIGGICTGQDVNLSGDGSMTGWRVFEYALQIAQGFALRMIVDGKTQTYLLNQSNFPELTFRGEYPIAKLEYANPSIPVSVNLEAFSPFIPLNSDDSGLPATIFNFTVTNTTTTPLELTLAGSLENGVCDYNRLHARGTRRNEILHKPGITVLNCSVSGAENPLDQLPDYGTMAMVLVGKPAEMRIAKGAIGLGGDPADEAVEPLAERLIGTVGRTLQLGPGLSAEVTFIVAWYFPNLNMQILGKVGRYYANKFRSALAVASYVATNLSRLTDGTRLWRDTWYDSTLPYWFLDRTFINTSTLATSVCYRFANGRFYAYEGGPAPNYPGTCTHVWQYAHSVARVFPELERDTRQRVDLGVGLNQKTGVIGCRGEYWMHLAVDGQAGTIMRFYREHQMSPDGSFLRHNWGKIKITFKPLFARDADENGILEGDQPNTLDSIWFGQVSWMSSMYVGALRAGEQMARDLGDGLFAEKWKKIADNGTRNLASRLYNGEYFFNIIDPRNAKTENSGDGSHIDQVYGQSWAFQIGLPRVLPEYQTRQALRSLWKYNFSPNVFAYLAPDKPGRRFVYPGDAGMIMCTFPRTDWNFTKARGVVKQPCYFNETWTGQEYQVAAHMLWEGMLLEGLAVTRAIHDRYNPSKRNPWAEEEAGVHYSRAMASHGVFIGMCGFEYHGPRGHIGFAPKLSPENFRSAFITSEGWGTYSQTIRGDKMTAGLEAKSGKLRLTSMSVAVESATKTPTVAATLGGVAVSARCIKAQSRITIRFDAELTVTIGQKLAIGIS